MEAKTVEQMIQDAGAVAPRVTPERLKAVIKDFFYIRPTGTLTLCIMTLVNGFTVVGESACVSPENFREDIGQRISYENALDRIWPLEGYLLAQNRLESVSLAAEGAAIDAAR